MKIDHRQIAAKTLQSIIESFVQREGTDYGEHEYSLDQKVAEVKSQLDQNQVVLVFDAESESVNILTQDAFSERDLSE
jgi:uncharacterized protein YheU (UPF0270 family)